MSTNSGIVFSPPIVSQFNQLCDVSDEGEIANSLMHRSVPSYPPLRLSQILKLIENGNAEAISVLEWLSVLQDDFSAFDGEELNRICSLIWKAVSENDRLSRMAFYMAGLYLEGQVTKFPKELISTMPFARPLLRGRNVNRVSWLIAINENLYSNCVAMALNGKRTPFEYSKELGLPASLLNRKHFIKHILPLMHTIKTKQGRDWFLSCLSQMTRRECMELTESLLIDYATLHESLTDWLEENCLPSSNSTMWYELSSQSRQILNEKFRLNNFYTLEMLIEEMCSSTNAKSLPLSDRDIRQLNSRANFWSNYSEKISQTRLLIPYKVAEYVTTEVQMQNAERKVLPNELGEDAEVCILNIGNRIIVEVLRGNASEIRIFDASDRNKQRLFQDNNISLKGIRQMACSCIHDHVKAWQFFCEQMLRTQHDVLPNENTTKFKGLPRNISAYSQRDGLAKPSDTLLEERTSQLDSWYSAFWAREVRLNNLKEIPTTLRWRELQRAKIERLGNNTQKYALKLRKAAQDGDPEAMYLYGLHLLKLSTNYSKDKREGEVYLTKSAQMDYMPAKEIAAKYKLDLTVSLGKVKKNIGTSKRVNDEPSNSINSNMVNEIRKKLRVGEDRPYLALIIEELEILADANKNNLHTQKGLLHELSFRTQTKRVKNLINALNLIE